ncbi:MAG: hypothetical protein LBQ52_03090 [Helicobacteraceae bacterium]|jgi:hypothetical protein|nr:hypothetical protein [Helicobacteraceae bacterium]
MKTSLFYDFGGFCPVKRLVAAFAVMVAMATSLHAACAGAGIDSEVDLGNGYYIVKPKAGANSFKEPMLVYCKGSEVWLPLPISDPKITKQVRTYPSPNGATLTYQPNSNFAFTGLVGSANFTSRNYYYPHNRKGLGTEAGMTGKLGDPIFGIKINIGADKISLAQRFEFANINLIGTSLAIDLPNNWDTIGFINCGGNTDGVHRQETLIYGYNYQAVKINLSGHTKGNGNCEATAGVTLKQLPDYKYVERKDASKPEDRLYQSCKHIKSDLKASADGFYLINSPFNQRIPFVVYCIMDDYAGGDQVTTVFLALDGRNTESVHDATDSTVMQLGLTLFVPTSDDRFKNMQKFLDKGKVATSYSGHNDGWANYVGTVLNHTRQMHNHGGSYGGSKNPGEDVLFLVDNSICAGNAPYCGTFEAVHSGSGTMWPYGPMGIANSEVHTSANPALSEINSYDNDIIFHNGKLAPLYDSWGTIFDSDSNWAIAVKLNAMAEETLPAGFYLSSNKCRVLKRGDYGAGSPQGGLKFFVAGLGAGETGWSEAWLGFTFDNNGEVKNCDDQALAHRTDTQQLPYTYSHYVGVTPDSYGASPPKSSPAPKEAGAYDDSLDPIKDDPPATFTKIAEDTGKTRTISSSGVESKDIRIKVVPLDNNSYNGLLCVKLSIANLANASAPFIYTPNAIEGNQNPAPLSPDTINDYKCAAIADTQDLKANPIVFIWKGSLKASPEAVVQVLASSCSTIAEIGGGACETNGEINASYFSLRPSISGGVYKGKLISGVSYGKSPPYEALPDGSINAEATVGYKRDSLAQPCKADNGLCIQAIDKKIGDDITEYVDANITFSGVDPNKAQVNKIGYDNVGIIELWLHDKEWTIKDQNVDYGAAYSDIRWKNDCEVGGDSADVNVTGTKASNTNWGKIGCEIRRQIGEVTVPPAEFNITKMTITGPTKYKSDASYVYYADQNQTDLTSDNGQFVVVTTDAQALNAKGKVTDRYSDGNYSKDINHSLNFIQSTDGDMPGEVLENPKDRWGGYWDKVSVDPIITPASVWKNGEANLTYAINFNRSLRKPKPALFMNAASPTDPVADFNLSLEDEDNVIGSAGWTEALAGEFKKVDFIYGRAHLPDVSVKTEETNVSYAIDYFSDRIGSADGVRGDFNSPSALASSAGWYRIYDPSNPSNPVDGVTEAKIRTDLGSGTIASVYLLNGQQYQFKYDFANPRPRRFVSHLTDLPTYLWHHPFGKDSGYNDGGSIETRQHCFERPCGTIEFLPPDKDEWGGYGARAGGRHYDDNSTRDRAPIRLGR